MINDLKVDYMYFFKALWVKNMSLLGILFQ